ncbi:MAG TPA: alpha/beta hydrolase, partial [Smithellaceae bacterium]|nr:alpha/beta hydrolase [Smithellaceae bacterium]
RAKIGDLANDLRHFLTEIYRGKYPVTVIGHSMGALTLFEYVGRFGTDMISKMVIIDQTPKLLTNREWRLGMFGDCPAARNKEFIKAFNADIVKGIIYLTGFFLHKEIPARSSDQARFTVSNMPALTPEAASGLVSLWKSFTAKDFRPLVKKIAIPTLLLYGARSQFYKIETGEWMRDNIAGSRLKIFPAGDHNPFLGQPEEFFQGIKEFVLE